MKFGRRLQEESFEEFQPHYIAYKELKKAIKLITGQDTSQFTISEVTNNFGNIPALAGSTYRPPESRFQDLLNFEVNKINGFSALVYSSITSSLKLALRKLFYGEVETLKDLETLYSAADNSADGVAYLYSYVNLNFTGFRKITKKYDKHNKSSASAYYLTTLIKEEFVNMNFDYLVELISVCFSELRRTKFALLTKSGNEDPIEECGDADLDAAGFARDDVMGPQQTSQMTNTTYLVGEHDIMKVRIHLAKHIPLKSLGPIRCPNFSLDVVKSFLDGIPDHHSIGSTAVPITDVDYTKQSRFIATKFDESGKFTNPAIYKYEQNRASEGSLYFDTKTLQMYKSLLSPQVNEKEAKILRLRWNVDQTGQRSHDQSSLIIAEIVKAFEPADSPNEWYDLDFQSLDNNNAIIMNRQSIASLINGTLDSDDGLLHPDSRKEVLEKIGTLLRQQNFIFQRWCHRTNFRKTETHQNDQIFAHLDENVRFVDASSQLMKDPQFLNISVPPHLAPNMSFDTTTCICPFGLLSISLSGNYKPNFLPKITGLTSVTEVWRYAPHLHGTALIKKSLLSHSELPHWYQFITTDEDVKSSSRQEKVESRRSSIHLDTNLSKSIRVDVVSSHPSNRLLHEHAITTCHPSENLGTSCSQVNAGSFNVPSQQDATSLHQTRRSHGLSGLTDPLLSSTHMGIPVSPEATYQTPTRVDSNARTPLLIGAEQSYSSVERNTLGNNLTLAFSHLPSLPSWMHLWGDRAPKGTGVGSAAVRVEPKTFFANERTLLQWMNTAVLLSTISITLLNFGTPTGRLAGLIMAPVALFFIIYSFLVYLRRSYSLEKKEPINYNDRIGPAILVLCLICALSAIIFLNILYGPESEIALTPKNASHSHINNLSSAVVTVSPQANVM